MNKKKCLKIFFIIYTLLFFVLIQNTYSQDVSWRILNSAIRAYEDNNLGQALKLAENAKEKKIDEYRLVVKTLESVLAMSEVQQEGDNIDSVISILINYGKNDVIEIITKAIGLYGYDFFSNSVKNIKTHYEKSKVYPEADYLLGKIYVQESEYKIAEEYYQKALSNSFALDIPDCKYDILYDIAYLSQIQGNMNEYEEYLLLIMNDDPSFNTNNNESVIKNAITKSIITQTGEKANNFFKLFRDNHYFSIKACFLLSDYYIKHNENNKALSISALGVIKSFTRVSEILALRDMEYEYSQLNDFFCKAISYPDIKDWLASGIWSGYLSFAMLVKNQGNIQLSDYINSAIILYSDDIYLQNLANKQKSQILY